MMQRAPALLLIVALTLLSVKMLAASVGHGKWGVHTNLDQGTHGLAAHESVQGHRSGALTSYDTVVGTRSRKLQQQSPVPIASANSVQHSLEQVCPDLKNSNAATFTCIVKEFFVEGGQALEVTVPMPHKKHKHGIEVTVEPFGGDPDLYVVRLDSTEDVVHLKHSFEVTGIEVVEIPSSTAYASNAQQSTIVVQVVAARNTAATFQLTIEVLPEGKQVSDRDGKVIADLSTACCLHGGCADTLQTYPEKQAEVDVCSLPGWHCNGQGHLTHLRIRNRGLRCSVDALKHLSRLANLHLFELDDEPGLSGDINTLLNAFTKDHSLRRININSTSLSGTLPTKCSPASILHHLLQLHISYSPVEGSVPDCAMKNLESLALHYTQIGGTLPPLSTASNMWIMSIIQGDDAPRMAGNAEHFVRLKRLEILRLQGTDISGTLTAGPALRELRTIGNTHTAFKASNAASLELVAMEEGKLEGDVPAVLLNAQNLLELNLRKNSLSGIPMHWSAPRMRYLVLSDNNIRGPLPAGLAEQSALERADVSGNEFMGPIAAFSENIGTDSRLYSLSIANNRLTGPLSGLSRLGVFRFITPAGTPPGARVQTQHVFNVSNNNFEGQLPLDYYAAASAGGRLDLPLLLMDLRSNPFLTCPDPAIYSTQVLIYCSPRGAPPITVVDTAPASGADGLSTAALVGVVLSVLAMLVGVTAGAAYYFVRRRKAQKQAVAVDSELACGDMDTGAIAQQAPQDGPGALHLEMS